MVLMDETREVSLSTRGQDMAQCEGIATIVSAIENCDEYNPWVTVPYDYYDSASKESVASYIKEFQESDSFQRLDREEQERSIRSGEMILDCDAHCHWQVEVGTGNDRRIRQIKTLAHDALLVCGITIDDIHRVSPRAVDFYEDLGFGSRIEMANFVGACILAKRPSLRGSFVDFLVTSEDGLSTKIGVGGSFHGDFMINSCELFTEGSKDPLGSMVEFAPRGYEFSLGARDKQELSLLVALIKHLDYIGLPEADQKELIYNVVVKFNKNDDGMRGGSQYGDFGIDSGSLKTKEIITYVPEVAIDEIMIWDDIYCSNELDSTIQISTEGDEFTLQYAEKCDDSTFKPVGGNKIGIKPEALSDFLFSLLCQAKNGFGRTSVQSMVRVLQARYEVDWR